MRISNSLANGPQLWPFLSIWMYVLNQLTIMMLHVIGARNCEFPVKTSSYQRRCNAMALHRCWCNVVQTLRKHCPTGIILNIFAVKTRDFIIIVIIIIIIIIIIIQVLPWRNSTWIHFGQYCSSESVKLSAGFILESSNREYSWTLSI